jgi:hypothetical protein
MPINREAYPTKEKRIDLLRMWGLNTADSIHFARGEFAEDKAKDKTKDRAEEKARKFFEKHECVSVRTFSDESRKCMSPVRYEIKEFEEVNAFCMENTGKYHILINEAIALKDALVTGKITWEDNLSFDIEYFYGPGTPRDLENIDRALLRVAERTGKPRLSRPLSDDANTNFRLLEVVDKIQNADEFIKTYWKPIMFEFQYYPYPVGVLGRHDVFWEWLLASI